MPLPLSDEKKLNRICPRALLAISFSSFLNNLSLLNLQSAVTHLKQSPDNGSVTIGFSVGKQKIQVRHLLLYISMDIFCERPHT